MDSAKTAEAIAAMYQAVQEAEIKPKVHAFIEQVEAYRLRLLAASALSPSDRPSISQPFRLLRALLRLLQDRLENHAAIFGHQFRAAYRAQKPKP